MVFRETKKMKNMRVTIGAVLTFLLSGILFIGNFFYRESVQRGSKVELHREKIVGDENESGPDEHQLQNALSWYDEQNPVRLTQLSDDGLLLQADFIRQTTRKNRAVILVHGFRKQKEDMRQYAKFYYDRGYDVLLTDSRGHGESEGGYYGFGGHDRFDMLRWIDYLIVKEQISDIVLHGNSMGAATVLMTSGEPLPEQVKGIIADSGFTTMKEELSHQLKHLYRMPSFPLIPITSFITKFRAGYFYSEVAPIEQVKRNTLPLFIIHGDADDLVPTWMGEKLYEVAGGDKELWVVPDVGHIKTYEVETIECEKRMDAFLSKLAMTR